MPITRATNLAGLGTIFDSLTDGGGLSVSGISTFTDLNITRVNITGVGTISNGSITNLTGTSSTITTFTSTNGSITNLTGTAGTITTLRSTTLNADTGNIVTGVTTNFTSTNGTITNLTGTAGTITTLRSTTGNFTTGNIVTGVTTNFTSTNASITNLIGTSTIQITGFANPSSGTGLELGHDGTNGIIQSFNRATSAYKELLLSGNSIQLSIAGGEAARIDSSRRLLLGTSSARTDIMGTTARLQVEGESFNTSRLGVMCNINDAQAGAIYLAKSRGSSAGGVAIVSNGDKLGDIEWGGTDGTDIETAARITAFVDGTVGANRMPGRLIFSTATDASPSVVTERMRIDTSGRILIATTNTNPAENNVNGAAFEGDGRLLISTTANEVIRVNRKTNDGNLIIFHQDGTQEGTISVSGTTVSYNGAHLSRWSQLPTGAERIEILRGSVLSNLDEMCEWGDEENEQLNRMKVSTVEGDKNVSGVFQCWDDDDDTYINDFYCAMTGDFIIRIADGVTVERGDLLMSAGNGTAKPQGDGYVQDKTIAKVTSTNVSFTYEDGSYCVPCVLMAC